MRDFQNDNPYFNAGGNLRGRYQEAGGVNRYFRQQMRDANQSGNMDAFNQAQQGLRQAKDFRQQTPGMFGQPTQAMPEQVSQPGGLGVPTMGGGMRQFANGNPYYNAQGELRNRFAQAGGVNQFYQDRIRAANQAGDMDAAGQYQQRRRDYKAWNQEQGGAYMGDEQGTCPYCGK